MFLVLIIIPAFLQVDIPEASAEYEQARKKMVSGQIRSRGISDKTVLAALNDVQRHLFVPQRLLSQAYADHPLPIGGGQTISQPYIVALMTESLGLTGEMNVLEIGTGSGYQAAVLSKVVNRVYTMEIKKNLHTKASNLLQSMGLVNVETRHGDGYFGWEAAGPFDGIMITAAVDHIPPPLLKQLKNGGKLILPLGNPFSYQNLVLVTKKDDDYTVKQIIGVLFVPMTGHALERRK
jgi:protein-L-isoaspartate(D-aspartate) O-methyltransferase